MKFVSFIASTMLIVLISQYSVIGFPLNDTVVEERCSEGFEKIDGHCIPISVTTSTHTIESETHHTEPLILHEEQPITTLTPVKISGRCPEGMEHGEHGICQEIKLSENITTTEINIKSTTDVNNDKHKEVNLKDCPEGAKRDKDGICQEIKLSSTTTPIIESKILPEEDEPCLEGMKRDKHGICQEIKLSSTTTPIIESKILPKEDEPCLEGMKRDKDGICKEIKLSESITITEINIKSTTDVNDDKHKEVNIKDCPEGTKHNKDGVCEEIKLSESTKTIKIDVKLTTDITDDKHEEVNLKDCPEGAKRDKDGVCQEIKLFSTTTPIIESKILPKEDEPCLEGMKRDKGGICKEIKLSESTTTTEDNIVSTTDVNDDKRKEVNLMECPEGAKRDEDGSCQPIQPSSTTKPITDPKILLKEDGSCPDDYKMIEGRCLYVKPKTKSTLPLKTSDDDVSSIQPKVGKDISQYELVPVLADNSCPEGTEQAEFGLCQKRVPTCPIGSEFLDGKCLPKRLPSGPKFTTSTSIPETTPIQRPIDHDELTKSTPETKPIEQPIDHDELIKSTPELETGTITIHEKTEKVITKPVQRLHAQE